MPTLKAALVQRLILAPSINALTASRIHWNSVPQGTAFPYVRLSIISDPRPIHLGGYNGSRETRVQADCFAATNREADQIAHAIITAMLPPYGSGADGKFGRSKAEGPTDRTEVVDGIPTVHCASLDLLVRHSFP